MADVDRRLRPAQEQRKELRRRAWGLVAHIQSEVLPSPGRRAALRRAAGMEPGDPRTFGAFREVARFLPERANQATQRAFLGVAALMCAQPRQARQNDIDAAASKTSTTPEGQSQSEHGAGDETSSKPVLPRSLGATLAYAVNEKAVSESSAEDRLQLVCRNNSTEAHRQLPRLMALLRSSQISVDWVALICDLAEWDRFRQRKAAAWLRDFYRTLNDANDDPSTNNTQEQK
ncbi:type I-E CRISPR-associated protein Cse2/CasB [Salinactinospora qingdaonensis]|uniref:CRISPR system Cascade subunit CasB n=1 Tax=Salinactinospora qingdaonensis TaxID=702744 RepID=A0ABP7GAQ0_9ACTN